MDKMLSKSEKVGRLYSDMSQELLLRMIQRIKQRGAADLQNNPYLWHLDKLRDMHALNEANIKYVVEQTGIAREIIDDVLQHEGLAVYEDSAKRVSKDTGKPLPSYNGVKDTLSAYASQAFSDVDNLVNQTLLSRNVDTNPVMRVYQDILTKVVSDVVNGLRSPEQAVSRAVMDWVNKGIPSAFIDKAGRAWSIESYVNSVMTSTTYRVYNEMRTESAKDLGVNTFHMSSHQAARPACAHIQGHIVTTAAGFNSHDKNVGYVYSLADYGYGRPDGTLGINCHHVLTPFVIGVNELPDEDIPNEKEAIANGKKQAKQRSFERGIRNAKKQLAAAKALGDDKLIARYRDLLQRRQGGLNQLLLENRFLVPSSKRQQKRKTDRTPSEPMPEVEKKRLFAEAKAGGAIIRTDREAIEHLDTQGAHGSHFAGIILLRPDADRSTIREEIYHFKQWKNGNPYSETEEEIRVKMYLINNADRFNIPERETLESKKLLEEELKKYEAKYNRPYESERSRRNRG